MSCDQRLVRGRMPLNRKCGAACRSRTPSRSWMGEPVAGSRPVTPCSVYNSSRVPNYRDHTYQERIKQPYKETIYPQEWYRAQDSRNLQTNQRDKYHSSVSNAESVETLSQKSYRSENKSELDSTSESEDSASEDEEVIQPKKKLRGKGTFEVIYKYNNKKLDDDEQYEEEQDSETESHDRNDDNDKRSRKKRRRLSETEFHSEVEGNMVKSHLKRKQVRIRYLIRKCV